MRKWLVICGPLIIFSAMSLLFWLNEWKYSLSTLLPESYHAVHMGEFINISDKIKSGNKQMAMESLLNSRFNIVSREVAL